MFRLIDHDQLREVRLRDLRDKVRVGLDQARRGDLVDGDTVFREIEGELDEQERTNGKT